MEKLSLLLLNQVEAAMLLNLPAESSRQEIIEKLAGLLPQVQVVMTLGSAGSVYIFNGQCILQDAFKVKAVDTTGAGDTFAGFFTACLMKEIPVKEALKIAEAAGAVSVTRVGAAASIPSLQEVKAFINKN